MFDLEGLRAAVAEHGRVVRVVVAGGEGSVPREVGAAMLVWDGGMAGTIGGGALEWQAVQRARGMPGANATAGDTTTGNTTGADATRVERVALGPALGQCCGGAVTLVFAVYDAARVAGLAGEVIATGPGEMPLAVRRVLTASRGAGAVPAPGLVQGWMVEPVARPEREVWVWGAGHVGRALVSVLAPLPGMRLIWVDVLPERFPDAVPEGVTVVPAAAPEALVAQAPAAAEHLVVTFSHALDLELCHRLLGHGFRSLGLIGSATKAARFRGRLAALGHSAAQIARIRCPIGDPALGKHPQAIAIGVAVGMIGEAVAAGRADDRDGTG